jgi:hypothetical protein
VVHLFGTPLGQPILTQFSVLHEEDIQQGEESAGYVLTQICARKKYTQISLICEIQHLESDIQSDKLCKSRIACHSLEP